MELRPPHRAQHTYIQALQAPPDQVFPLLCPVREREWVPGWDPLLVLSSSGVAEEGCVFVTPGDRVESTWVITRYDPPQVVEFVKHTPGETVCTIRILLRPGAEGHTEAEVMYAHTSLGPEGDRVVDAFTAEYYRSFMEGWENALNHFLETGSLLTE